MVEAIIRSLLTNGTIENGWVSVNDISDKRTAYLQQRYNVKADVTFGKELEEADIIVLGVRPQDDLAAVGELISLYSKKQAIVVSLIAGVSLKKLQAILDVDRAIVRVIPNTLTDTGFGYSGVVMNHLASEEDVHFLLTGFGKVMYIEERLLDIFTGFGVAGPNYIYYFLESFIDAGVLSGMPRDLAWEVALENMLGAVEMLNQTGKHPRQLLDINNSPAGVGMNGLYELNNSDFAAALQRSVLKAVSRTTEIGK